MHRHSIGLVASLCCASALGGCTSGQQPTGVAVRPEPGKLRTFDFVAPDGSRFSSASTRGRATAVLFVATFDMVSQQQARQLDEIVRRHTPRANAGAVVLEAPKYSVFIEEFREQLGLSFPVVMADRATREGRGGFGAVRRVPTLVVLDRQGREVFRDAGMMEARDIEKALATASERR